PLGYDLMRPFLRLQTFGLPYRVAQMTTFGLLAILLLWWMRDNSRRNGFALLALFTLTILNLSAMSFGTHFFGSALAFMTLALFAEGSGPNAPPERRRAVVLLALSGACMGLIVLVRPVFALYTGGVLAAVALLAPASGAGGRMRAVGRLAVCFAAAVLVALAVWGALYPDVAVAAALYPSPLPPSPTLPT